MRDDERHVSMTESPGRSGTRRVLATHAGRLGAAVAGFARAAVHAFGDPEVPRFTALCVWHIVTVAMCVAFAVAWSEGAMLRGALSPLSWQSRST
ncbi:hypothetical protein [Nannocystis pusilla]|uniref:hypothetical protein n=1 Tax=Nannocystis pusilla TaxID=889268 RepID=UPI003B81552E